MNTAKVVPQKQLVVIGNGMAGIRAVEELLQSAPDDYQITIIGKEPYGSYNRIMLSPVLAGESTIPQIVTHDYAWYEQRGITLLAGEEHEAVRIHRGSREVETASGARIPYDRLLLATGSNPINLPLPGADAEGVLCFRGIRDVNSMLSKCQQGQHAVVIGAGLLGLEAANGLAKQGLQVTVIHLDAYPLNRQLDQQAAGLLQQELESRGIVFRLEALTQCIHTEMDDEGTSHAKSVELKSGEVIPADLVVMAIGVRPEVSLAKVSGLETNRGILVNDAMQTFDPAIYAVGECIEHRGMTFGLVEPLYEQAKVCANHLSSHGFASYVFKEPATRLKVSGVSLFSAGQFDLTTDADPSVETIHYQDLTSGIYKKLVLQNNQLVGAVLYGDTQDGPWYYDLLRDGTNISPFRSGLIFGRKPEAA